MTVICSQINPSKAVSDHETSIHLFNLTQITQIPQKGFFFNLTQIAQIPQNGFFFNLTQITQIPQILCVAMNAIGSLLWL